MNFLALLGWVVVGLVAVGASFLTARSFLKGRMLESFELGHKLGRASAMLGDDVIKAMLAESLSVEQIDRLPRGK